jgi:predicted metal-binding protein
MPQNEAGNGPIDLECVQSLGFTSCAEFDASMLVPAQRIHDLCIENRCGKYTVHYMCPPYSGTPEQITQQLGAFKQGILLQYSRPLDVEHDKEGLKETKREFHEKLLQLEACLRDKGLQHTWALTAGSCELCETCYAVSGEPCPYPDKARTSLVALGIDVISLLDRLGVDSKFHHDKITWTGCVLF